MHIDYSKRIFGLDFMRAVAIFLVVFSSIGWIMPNAQGLIPELMSMAGVIGIEIFFVLSGFLVGKIIYKLYISEAFKFSKVWSFWVRRWFRVVPNYYLALFMNLIIAIYFGTHLSKNSWHYGFFLQNFAWEAPSFYIESWSISVGEFAYIIGPLLLYLTLFIKLKTSKSKLFFWITVFIILMFTLTKVIYNYKDGIHSMTHWNASLKSVVIYRIDAIYYGVLAAFVSIVRPKFWNYIKYVALMLSVVLFLGLNIMIPLKHLYIETQSMFWNVWYLPINSIVIVLTLPLLSSMHSASKFIQKPVTYLSLMSYAVYVLHYSIVLQLLKFFIPTESLPSFDRIVFMVVYGSTTMLLSYFMYRFYEKPLTGLRDSQFIKKKFK